MGIADEFRALLVRNYRGLEADLKGGEDILCTVYLPSGPFELFLGGVYSSAEGLVSLAGIKNDGKKALICFHARDVHFVLEIIASNKPRRIGFNPE